MKWFIVCCYSILTLLALTLGQIFIRELLPFPFNQINAIYGVSAWLIIIYGDNRPLWLTLTSSILLGFFSSAPFGAHSFVLISSLAVFSWLLGSVFANLSTSIVALSGGLACLAYRLIWIFLMIILNLNREPLVFSLGLFQNWMSEILLSTMLLVLLYFFSTHFIKRLKPHYIDLRRSPTV